MVKGEVLLFAIMKDSEDRVGSEVLIGYFRWQVCQLQTGKPRFVEEGFQLIKQCC